MIMAKQYSDKTNAIIYAVIGCGLLIWALLGAGFYALRHIRLKKATRDEADGSGGDC